MRLILIALAALALAPAAAAGTIIDRAVTGLSSNPVYVDPAATKTITAAQAAAVRQEIETKGDGPIYIAILPAAALDEAGGDALGIVDEIHRQLGDRGAYAVVAGGHFRAEATDLNGKAADLATKAFNAHHSDGIAPTLTDFVDRVGATRSGKGDGSGGGIRRIGLFPILLLGGIAFFLFRRFKRRRVQADEFREVKETVRQDLVALADDVQGLEQRVESNEPAKHDYLAALEQYARASGAFDQARSPQQLAPVGEALEEGRYLMASAEARLDGKSPPERRPACFFDPRHGPSVRDVEWSPPGGQPREVPACAADAIRIEEGGEPDSRQVLVGGQAMPYWAAGPMYGGYFGGFFPGLMLGELMGGFGGYGFGGFGGYDGGGGDDAGGGMGDFGGGGGDFGGGDFGGGDGGGGDF
ncbi:MAG: hypothetical protein H0X39_02730 [Actinobacteria bacterium]|nr:hypothetical protein [Actinomycetota bacterium]